MVPEEFLSYLEAQEAEAKSKEATVKGFNVTTVYTPLAESEKQARKQAIRSYYSAIPEKDGREKK